MFDNVNTLIFLGTRVIILLLQLPGTTYPGSLHAMSGSPALQRTQPHDAHGRPSPPSCPWRPPTRCPAFNPHYLRPLHLRWRPPYFNHHLDFFTQGRPNYQRRRWRFLQNWLKLDSNIMDFYHRLQEHYGYDFCRTAVQHQGHLPHPPVPELVCTETLLVLDVLCYISHFLFTNISFCSVYCYFNNIYSYSAHLFYFYLFIFYSKIL